MLAFRPSSWVALRASASRRSSVVLINHCVSSTLTARLKLLPRNLLGAAQDWQSDMQRSQNDIYSYNGGVQDAEVVAGAENWASVVGVPLSALFGKIVLPEDVPTLLQRINNRNPREPELRMLFASWAPVLRGRDVFLPGMERFDIAAIVDDILKTRDCRLPSRRELDWACRFGFIKAALLKSAAGAQRQCGAYCFENKRQAIQCLLDDRDGVADPAAFYAKLIGQPNYVGRQASHRWWEEWENQKYYFLSPTELRARGHFSKIFAPLAAFSPEYEWTLHIIVKLLSLPEQDLRRRHLERHCDWWDHPDHGGALDELLNSLSFRRWTFLDGPDGSSGVVEVDIALSTMKPPQLLNFLREQNRLAKMGPDVRYAHLDDLPDELPPGEPLPGGRTLSVLRSSHQIEAAATKLKNCASSYTYKVQANERVLVMLNDATNKPVALAEFDTTIKRWVQIRETANRTPTEATRMAFAQYLPRIKTWCAKQPPRTRGSSPL